MKEKRVKTSIGDRLNKSGAYVYRYRKIYMAITIIIACFEAILIGLAVSGGRYVTQRHLLYLSSYVVLFIVSIGLSFLLMLVKNKKSTPLALSIVFHFYCVFIVAWATVISCLDMMAGNYPIVYLTILMTIGGLVSIHPIFYGGLVLLSLPWIIMYTSRYADRVGFSSVGSLFNIGVFIVMSAVVAYRMYAVTMKESAYKDALKKSANTDALTGLGNERSYFKLLDQLDTEVKQYGVVLLDLNGLKATNDAFGHRYGCHLVVETGHRLPSIFPNSKLFHIGGDEFIAVVIGKDYEQFESLVMKCKGELAYTTIEYDDHTLVLSVAVGAAKRESQERFSSVLQRADDAMYQNKIAMKEKLSIPSREN